MSRELPVVEEREIVKADEKAVAAVVKLFQNMQAVIGDTLRRAGLLLARMDKPTLRRAKAALARFGYQPEYVDRLILVHNGGLPEWTVNNKHFKIASFVRKMSPAAVKAVRDLMAKPTNRVKVFSDENPKGVVEKPVRCLSHHDMEILFDSDTGISTVTQQMKKAAELQRKSAPIFSPVEEPVQLKVESITFDHKTNRLNLRLSNGECAVCEPQVVAPFKSIL
jgi:hypothetical protein